MPNVFSYRLFMLYLDLAELPELFARRWLWSAERPALAWFRRADHVGDPREPLDASVRALVEKECGRRPEGPIRLLTHLRYGGYAFNPVSFYYCFDASGCNVETIVAEVTNTPWGERHCYVLDAAGRPIRGHVTRKAMHVSPFLPMDMDYLWTFSSPAEQLAVTMRCVRGGEPVMHAALTLSRREMSASALARVLVLYPLMTAQVIGRIYWQALRLWVRGARFHTHPEKLRTR